ncbi:YqaJ viral recombinase family protein [Bradyrhizobium sp. SYSU BS000235]|uniref:YqaJ viral recombinase family nuclease n=1 Tax=Bradyrhizobium sp. SYSU BS000235 TaxID=3411332 RepID=UPI003C7351B8
MTIQRIPVTDRDSWLAMRKQDVTASVVGALFGCHPYESLLRVYLDKTGESEPEEQSAFLQWRLILESAVAAAVQIQRPEWKIVKATEYLRDPVARIGATPDFYIHGDPRGLGVLQAKTVAPKQFREDWQDDQPPFWIALQNATELMLETKASFGAVAALVISPYKLECPIFDIPRHPGVEKRIRDAVADFWTAVDWGNVPEPDYSKDAELIAAIAPEPIEGKRIDLTGDNMLPGLLAERAGLKAEWKSAEARIEEIDAEIKFKMGDAEIATIDGFAITFKPQPRKASFSARKKRSCRRLIRSPVWV